VSELFSERFVLGGLLGTGASAAVYEALDTVSGEQVALKILHSEYSHDEAMREAFFAEARLVEGLSHPNVAAAVAYGASDSEVDQRAWIAMRFAPGVSLAEHVETHGVPPVPEALAVMQGVLAALEAIHAAGLAHRDVTPANVMVRVDAAGALTAEGTMLIDFGLADVQGTPATGWHVLRGIGAPTAVEPTEATPTAPTPKAGVVGSVHYISPEQARGQAVDARGDVYQAGCLLYFALTGQPPFPAETAALTLRAHATEPPPVPSMKRPQVPRAVDRVVVRAMLKDPGARFASAAEFAVALAGASGASSASTTVVPQSTTIMPRAASAAMVSAATQGIDFYGNSPQYLTDRELIASQRPTSRRGYWWLAVVVLAVAVVVWGSFAFANRNDVPAPVPSASATTTRDPSVAPTATATLSAQVLVPAIVGKTADEARASLTEAGLTISSELSVHSSQRAGTVVTVSPSENTSVKRGSRVELRVASGQNSVPMLLGLTQSEAISRIQEAGFVPVVNVAQIPGTSPDRVVDQSPSGDSTAVLGASVIVLVNPPAPTPAATPSPQPTNSPIPSPTPSP
jgi:serine/threonine protein kinase